MAERNWANDGRTQKAAWRAKKRTAAVTFFGLGSAFCILHSYNDSSLMAEHPLPPARARFRTLAGETSIPIEADDLIALAKRYADQGMFDESIHLYEMAEKLKPGSVA